jgi:hypothetical protein
MFNIDIKNFNIYTILSILFLLAGLFYYIYWGTRYGIWYDIGIYSITIVMIIPGVVGILLSLREKEEED